MNPFSVRAAAALALGLAVPALAHAEGGVQVGTLACSQQPGWGYIIGSSRRIACLYQSPRGEARYVGRMTEAGVDVGFHGRSRMVWAVFAPTNRIGPGALAGQYGGATAGGAVLVGVSGNGLVGGSDRTIHLQPFSVSGNTGLSATVGIAGMSLVYQAPRVAYAPRRAWASERRSARVYAPTQGETAQPPRPPRG